MMTYMLRSAINIKLPKRKTWMLRPNKRLPRKPEVLLFLFLQKQIIEEKRMRTEGGQEPLS